MSQWTEYFRIVTPAKPKTDYVTSETSFAYNNYTWYSQLLKGIGDRTTKYITYDQMDTDADISRALDTVAEQMTTFDRRSDEPFKIQYHNDDDKEIDANLIVMLKAAARHWSEIHHLASGKLFSIARATIKYGDCFFRKTSDFKQWKFIHPRDILGIEVDDDGHIVNYHIRQSGNKNTNSGGITIEVVPKEGMIHFTLSDNMTENAPFGESILANVVRTYRQLKLLEDAIIIYRVVRAPERRVFKIDTGNMPAHKVKAYLEALKNDLRQKKMPVGKGQDSQTGTDVVYNPEAIMEDFFLAQPANGRGSTIEVLPGGGSLGDLDDVKYFKEKLYKGLRIPSSYMNSAGEAGGSQYNDGKVGVAYMEELSFSNYVQRLQYKIENTVDKHFKRYLKSAEVKIEESLFSIRLPDPQNFASYRQNAIDAELVNVFGQIKDTPFMSRRFLMKRYLGWTEEDIQLNEMLLMQELNTDETANVPTLQQIYDPKFEDSREAPKIEEPEEPEPEEAPEGENPEEGGKEEKPEKKEPEEEQPSGKGEPGADVLGKI
jgi:hypothetical protein